MNAIGGPKWLRDFKIRMAKSNIGHAQEAIAYYYELGSNGARFCDLLIKDKKAVFLKMTNENKAFYERPDQHEGDAG